MLIPVHLNPAIAAALAWAALAGGCALRSLRNYHRLEELGPSPGNLAPHAPPDCMVVIPARNEEGFVGRAVKSFPADTVLVVDDGSEDKTASEAREAGAGVIRALQPLGREVGKPNACMQGARVLTSRWILFADADTHYQPGFLAAAVGAAEDAKADFVSFYLKPEFATAAESILSAFAIALYFCGVNPQAVPAAAFNGQCILVRRDPYEFVGGHKSVLQAICDDLKMAQLAERHRLKFRVYRAPQLGGVRMRPGDFVRNATRFGLIKFSKGAMVLLAALVFALWLPVLVWLAVERQWALAAVFFFLPAVFLSPWYKAPQSLLAPLAAYGILPILFRGLLAALSHGRVEWKGRVI